MYILLNLKHVLHKITYYFAVPYRFQISNQNHLLPNHLVLNFIRQKYKYCRSFLGEVAKVIDD